MMSQKVNNFNYLTKNMKIELIDKVIKSFKKVFLKKIRIV